MQRDIRHTAAYIEAEAFYREVRKPGSGQISDGAEVHVSPDGRHAVLAGVQMDRLEGAPTTRVCEIDMTSGDLRVLSFGPNTDRLPRYSPDGRSIAFLSDRHRVGDFQLYLLERATGAARPMPTVEGWVEYFHWSPDGQRILLAVAGHGADLSGGQGAISSQKRAENVPDWMPAVETGNEDYRWRRAWVLDVASEQIRAVGKASLNIWEASWCGDKALTAVASHGPGEGLWYRAKLYSIELRDDSSRELYRPADQLGWVSASPSGRQIAVVEALCSDRWVVAGNLLLIDSQSGAVRSIDTHGVDIAHTEWRSERQLLVAGHRGFETVVGLCDAESGSFREIWTSAELTTGGFFVSIAGSGEDGDFALVAQSFKHAPEVACVERGRYRTVRSFDPQYAERAAALVTEAVSWSAPDGLSIQGWLVRKPSDAPQPLVMVVHGGPVWHSRPMWLGRSAALWMLAIRGYAIFFPNPRGSAGRGQDFARRVLGDMGGADTYDYLSGLDHLCARGIADPARLGVIGASYGGFMTSWLITQDSRFAAAIPVAPVTNQVTEHLVSTIPHFVAMFLDDHYSNPGGKYFERSPVMHAHKAKTPTLSICGALDRVTPPEEAVQFHNALLENGVHSVLVTYPFEGHGIRMFPAAIDYAARVVSWFEEHMCTDRSRQEEG
jgi:dipeptidyl aminopeptidase/acylaminoacyl peptidase